MTQLPDPAPDIKVPSLTEVRHLFQDAEDESQVKRPNKSRDLLTPKQVEKIKDFLLSHKLEVLSLNPSESVLPKHSEATKTGAEAVQHLKNNEVQIAYHATDALSGSFLQHYWLVGGDPEAFTEGFFMMGSLTAAYEFEESPLTEYLRTRGDFSGLADSLSNLGYEFSAKERKLANTRLLLGIDVEGYVQAPFADSPCLEVSPCGKQDIIASQPPERRFLHPIAILQEPHR